MGRRNYNERRKRVREKYKMKWIIGNEKGERGGRTGKGNGRRKRKKEDRGGKKE